MRYKNAPIWLALAFLCSAAAGERCIAVDGDTLVCNRQKVRLVNVDAAEMNQAGGAAAKRRLQALISNRIVTLKPYGKDRYGRLLAEVYIDGRRIEQADVGPPRKRRR
jgi:endonuclease YncB( thermonuclease family)